MRTINIAGVNEKIYFEKLSNGLSVYLFPMENREQTFVSLMTKFGGGHTEFVPYGSDEMIKVNEGVAHFLEHRLCTDKNRLDLFDFYAKTGAHYNAGTNSYRTRYYFECTKELEHNLIHLLDVIQDPGFREEDIEREKNIIKQEIKRYDDNPYNVLMRQGTKNTFVNHPVRNSVLGTIQDINSINKDALETCYRTFYHPSNMYLIVTGNFNHEEIIKVVRKNQKTKKLVPNQVINLKQYDEPDKVFKEYDEIIQAIDLPKLKYKIKLPIARLKKIKDYDLYLDVIFRANFGSTSLINEEIKKKRYMPYNINFGIDKVDSHVIVTLGAEGNQLEEIIREVDLTLNNMTVSDEDLKQFQKFYIGLEIMSYDDALSARGYIEDMLIENGKILNTEIDRIRNLNILNLRKVLSKLNLANKSITIMKPKKID